jgi:hypothetical protein
MASEEAFSCLPPRNRAAEAAEAAADDDLAAAGSADGHDRRLVIAGAQISQKDAPRRRRASLCTCARREEGRKSHCHDTYYRKSQGNNDGPRRTLSMFVYLGAGRALVTDRAVCTV